MRLYLCVASVTRPNQHGFEHNYEQDVHHTHTHTHAGVDRGAGQCCFSEIFGEEKRNVFKPLVAQSKGSVYSPTFSAQLFISAAAPTHHSSAMRLPW